MGALMRLEAVELLAAKTHRALLVAERAANAVHQGALARAVRPNQAQALTGGNGECNIFERHEAAETLTEIFDFQKCRCRASRAGAVRIERPGGHHGTRPGISASTGRRPTKSSGLR